MDEAAAHSKEMLEGSEEKASDWPATLKKLMFCDHDLQLKPIVTWGPSEYKESMLPFRPSVSSYVSYMFHKFPEVTHARH